MFSINCLNFAFAFAILFQKKHKRQAKYPVAISIKAEQSTAINAKNTLSHVDTKIYSRVVAITKKKRVFLSKA